MQCAPPKVREFETGAEIIAAAQLLRSRFRQSPPMRQPPRVAAPPIVVEQPPQKVAPPRTPAVRMSGNVFPSESGRAERPMVRAECPYTGEMLERSFEPPRCKDIIELSAWHYGVSVADLISPRRTDNIVWPRQVAIYLCCKITLRSLPFIGRALGRDHSTVLFSRRKIARLVESNDPDVASAIAAITGELRTRFTF